MEKFLYKILGFQRGQSPKQALNIGLRAKISSWLDEMEVKHYTINDDFTIDVDWDVYLDEKLDGNFPDFINFGMANKGFSCGYNNLTSLKGAPVYVAANFYCEYNKLTSLEGAPKSIGGDFICNHNDLTSLKGAPAIISGNILCDNNPLKLEDFRKLIHKK